MNDSSTNRKCRRERRVLTSNSEPYMLPSFLEQKQFSFNQMVFECMEIDEENNNDQMTDSEPTMPKSRNWSEEFFS